MHNSARKIRSVSTPRWAPYSVFRYCTKGRMRTSAGDIFSISKAHGHMYKECSCVEHDLKTNRQTCAITTTARTAPRMGWTEFWGTASQGCAAIGVVLYTRFVHSLRSADRSLQGCEAAVRKKYTHASGLLVCFQPVQHTYVVGSQCGAFIRCLSYSERVRVCACVSPARGTRSLSSEGKAGTPVSPEQQS